MNTDPELQAVKRELCSLKGATVFTCPQGKPNDVLDVTTQGFVVKTKSGVGLVKWSYVLNGYEALRANKVLSNKKDEMAFSYRGAFVMPTLAKLSTVEWASKKPPRALRYVEDGLPCTLKKSTVGATPSQHA